MSEYLIVDLPAFLVCSVVMSPFAVALLVVRDWCRR